MSNEDEPKPIEGMIVSPVSDQPAPDAPTYMERAAAEAGYKGRVHEWARDTLDAAAKRLLEGPPTIAKGDTPAQLRERIVKLRQYIVEQTMRMLMENGIPPEDAAKFAGEVTLAIESGKPIPEQPRILIASSAPNNRTRR